MHGRLVFAPVARIALFLVLPSFDDVRSNCPSDSRNVRQVIWKENRQGDTGVFQRSPLRFIRPFLFLCLMGRPIQFDGRDDGEVLSAQQEVDAFPADLSQLQVAISSVEVEQLRHADLCQHHQGWRCLHESFVKLLLGFVQQLEFVSVLRAFPFFGFAHGFIPLA